ncbi:MAG: uL15 family ribosomal protein, partial [Hyphomonadaceae bacterium]|nr:uL15 family ribosomal protein [Hyphomonadaceae bacterium]
WVNLGRLQAAIEAGKLDAAQPIDEAALVRAGLVRRVRDGVRLLARGEITARITLEVTGASAAAVAAVEAAGGVVRVLSPAPAHSQTGE